jgi:hypothetical protein
MSYAYSFALQAAVYRRLVADAGLAALIGDAIFDAPLQRAPDQMAPDYVTIGEETVRANGTKTSEGALHDFEVVAHSGRDGFDSVKRIAAAVCAALVDAPLDLEAGRLVALRFLRARADRGAAPEKRRISMRFRAVVDQE